MGRYRLGRRLGAGGFGSVHEAIDERLDRWVAVKVIPAEGTAPERARREALAAARLDHPGIVGIQDAGEEPGARYLVSELVEGRTLAQLEAAGELSDRDILRIGLALADALQHAHERGVVHRDVKPQNVLVPDHPRSWREAAKLADFGVAMLAGDDPLTMTGDVVGTLSYMAPEQAAGKRVDERADLYSLALVLYEALAEWHPVRGESPAATARKVGTQLTPLHRRRKDLPRDLTEAIDRALLAEPARRGDLDDLADALAEALPEVSDEGGGTIVRHPMERSWTWSPPARLLNAIAAAALVAGSFAHAGEPHPASAALAVPVLLLMPRLGWAVAMGFAIAVQPPGIAVLLAFAALPVPFLLGAVPAAWSAPAAAPLLGLVTLAGAFPALAAQLDTWVKRAALGAAGAWWLTLAEPLLQRQLVLGPVVDAATRVNFQSGASLFAADVLAPTFATGLPAMVLLWAAAAAVLPWIVRGWSLTLDVVAATTWAATLAAATAALGQALHLGEPRGLVFGAFAGAVIAVAGARARYLPHDEGE